MAVDKRRKDADWQVCSDDGRIADWNQCILSVLMDLRDELKRANQVWTCYNFQRIPGILDAIAREANRQERLRKKRLAARRAKAKA